MQPTPTPAHAGPVKPEETGTGPGPVHGTAVPTPRPALDDNPINEATTEIPMIVPKPADRNGPSPLPPIATQLLGGDAAGPGTPERQQSAQQDPAQQQSAPQDTTASDPGTSAGADGDADGPAAVSADDEDDDRDDPAAAAAAAQDTPSTPADDEPADDQADDERADDDPAAGHRAEPDAEPDGEDSGPVGQRAATADPADDQRSDPTAEVADESADDEETVTAHGDAGDLFYAADDDFDDDEDEDDGDDDEDEDEDDLDDDEDDEDDEEQAAMLTTVEEPTGPAAGHDEQPAAARPARPGDVTLPPITIWTEDAADELRDEWHEIKARFVDEPEVALAQAQSLVGHTVRTLAERLLAEQVELDPHRHSETPDTESMRMALRQYREFLDRLLAI